MLTRLLSKITAQDLIDRFNALPDFVRVLSILSPNCRDCVFGYETVRKLFERFNSSNNLRGFIVWTPMEEGDDTSAAVRRSAATQDLRIENFWDEEKEIGQLFARTLRLQNSIAWDVYLLYSSRIIWENEEKAPEPAFWMHQLDSDSSADPKLRLDLKTLIEETKFLLVAEDPNLADREITQVLLGKEKKI
jgi:hypothetical protein